jgi:hypothetical protein
METTKDETIYPTKTCFDDAAHFFNFQCIDAAKNGLPKEYVDQWVLVHGICEADDGIYSHAWVETADRKLALDFGIKSGEKICLEWTRSKFYAHRKVQETITYTPMQMAYASLLNGKTSGPWRKAIYKLTSDYDPKRRLNPRAERIGTHVSVRRANYSR